MYAPREEHNVKWSEVRRALYVISYPWICPSIQVRIAKTKHSKSRYPISKLLHWLALKELTRGPRTYLHKTQWFQTSTRTSKKQTKVWSGNLRSLQYNFKVQSSRWIDSTYVVENWEGGKRKRKPNVYSMPTNAVQYDCCWNPCVPFSSPLFLSTCTNGIHTCELRWSIFVLMLSLLTLKHRVQEPINL